MSTDLGPEFSEKYNAISNKLKKKFMRKPNVAEATEEFCELALECEHAEQPPFAGLCYIGAARSEGSIGNTIGEAEYLLLSARQFMKAEKKLDSLRCISPGKVNLEAAVSCYSHVNKRYPDKSALRSCVNLEVANNLEQLGHYQEAEVYYKNAMENFPNNPGHSVICLLNLASVFIKEEKYSEALNAYDKINDIIQDYNYNTYIERCEINRLFLYLIVQPSPKTVSPSMEKLLERYSIDHQSDEINLDKFVINLELSLLLQSVLTACKICEISSLIGLRTELKPFLSIEQQELLRCVIQKYESMK